MTTTRCRLTAEFSGYGKYHLWIVGTGGVPAGATHGVAVVPRSVLNGQLDTTGKALVDLDPTSELDEVGMVYRVDFRKTGSAVAEQRYFEVPVVAVTAPVTVIDIANYFVDPPGEVTVIESGGGAGTVLPLESGGGAVAA